MKNDILSEYYRPLLERNSFLPIPCPEKFSPAGQCWKIEPEVGGGYYWVYGKQDLYDIKIHDFFFHEDFELDMEIPECISILRYDSISGEELSPYRRLSAGDIQTIVGGNYRYRALIHKRIPVHSVGIEILPAYYEDFLKKQYPDDYFNLPAAFQSVDQATDFPAMSKLLFEVENYRSSGMAASLFFDAKVTEAISLVVDEIFADYLSRPGVRQPILTQYCDGRRVSCPNWLSQWGSKSLADDGYSTIDILRYYYGDSMYINTAEEIAGIPASWPGSDLTVGSTGAKVLQMQEQLNAIANVYTSIPKIAEDGIFGSDTAAAVRQFQSIFGLGATGIVDYPTWYKISEIYVGISRIAELNP